MKVALGSDHAGFELKENIKNLLDEMNIEYQDFGSDSTVSCDYSDYAIKVAEAVANNSVDRGILVCGTGIGMNITANKVKGIRAALVTDLFSAQATRAHNDSNVLCLGGRITGPQIAYEIVRIWLTTEFEAGKHKRRIDKIAEYEDNR